MRKKKLVQLVLLCCLLSNIVLFVVPEIDGAKLTPAQAGFLEDWTYRKSHTIIGSAGSGTDYQIRIIVHFDAGVDSGADAYCYRQCQPDFDDIRFTDDDGTTLLSYWVESYVWANASIFWVRISDSLDISAAIFLYFGNPSAKSESSGPETFIHFDDFETGYGWGSTESQMEDHGWTVENGLRDTVSVGGCPGGITGSCLHCVDASGAYNTDFEIHWNLIDGVAVHMNLYFAGPEDWWRVSFGGGSWAYTYVDFSDGMEFEWCHKTGIVGGNQFWNPSWIITEDTWQELNFQITPSSFEVEMDGTLHVGGVVENIVTDTEGYSVFVFEGCWGDNYYVDNVYVRKFVTNPPTHNSWMVEPDMIPTLGPEAPPEPINLGFILPVVVVCGIGVAVVVCLRYRRQLLQKVRPTPISSGLEIK